MKTSVRPSSMRTGTLTTRARRGKERRFNTPGSMSMTLATVSSCRQAILKVGELSKTGIGGGGIWPFPETVSVGADTEHSCTTGEFRDGILHRPLLLLYVANRRVPGVRVPQTPQVFLPRTRPLPAPSHFGEGEKDTLCSSSPHREGVMKLFLVYSHLRGLRPTAGHA